MDNSLRKSICLNLIVSPFRHANRKSLSMVLKASRKWFLEFDMVVSFGFKEDVVDQSIYLKVNWSKFIILVIFVDDLSIASNEFGFILKIK